MGVDYYAVAVIGIEIPKSRLYKRDYVPQCNHAVPNNAKFCPECGKAVQELTLDNPIKDWNPDKEMLGKYQVHKLMDEQNVVVAIAKARSGSNRSNDYHGSEWLSLDVEGTAHALQEYLSNLLEIPKSRLEVALHAIQDVSA